MKFSRELVLLSVICCRRLGRVREAIVKNFPDRKGRTAANKEHVYYFGGSLHVVEDVVLRLSNRCVVKYERLHRLCDCKAV